MIPGTNIPDRGVPEQGAPKIELYDTDKWRYKMDPGIIRAPSKPKKERNA